jgi:hypothetical protein
MALVCFVAATTVLASSLQATAAAAAAVPQLQLQPARGSSTGIVGTAGTAEPRQQRTFGIEEDAFMRDGVPVPLISGSIHYTRVHPAYWKDRLMRLRAMGLNTVCTYVPWMLHQRAADAEPAFDGPLDLAAFVREAQAQGLMVLLRLGPFIDAEYDFGGLPAWLLNLSAPALGAIRTNDTAYTSAVSRWFEALLPRVRPLLYENGGPIVMVQIENEYGAFAGSGLAPPTAAQTAYKSLLLGLARRMLGTHICGNYCTGFQQNIEMPCFYRDRLFRTAICIPRSCIISTALISACAHRAARHRLHDGRRPLGRDGARVFQ